MDKRILTDFHTHILPGIDDGSRNVEQTTQMLREESRQGVGRVIATPHFYANRISVEDFLKHRGSSLQKLKGIVNSMDQPLDVNFQAEDQLPAVVTGAEVYYFPGMGRAEKLKELCIEGTNTILLEMPFVQWNQDMVQEVQDILNRQKLDIVLAHVERYPEFQKDRSAWNRILSMPLTIQLNAGSFLKGWSRKRLAMRLLQENEKVIIGSDCHNMTSRKPNIQEARQVIKKKLGQGCLDQLDNNIDAIITG